MAITLGKRGKILILLLLLLCAGAGGYITYTLFFSDEPVHPYPHPAVAVPKPNPNLHYRQLCVDTMTDYAKKNDANPAKYIADNQAYLQQCIEYNAKKSSTGGKP